METTLRRIVRTERLIANAAHRTSIAQVQVFLTRIDFGSRAGLGSRRTWLLLSFCLSVVFLSDL